MKLLYCLALLGMLGCATSASNSNSIPSQNSDFFSCQIDSDCVMVKADCCGCNQGGKQQAINIKYKDTWNANMNTLCAGTMCIQVISKHPSCAMNPQCINGICRP